MKMLFCIECNDIFNLQKKEKTCSCGKTGGKYTDNVNAVYWGFHAVPLGFTNNSFKEALIKQPNDGLGSRYEAFIIPKNSPTMKRTNR